MEIINSIKDGWDRSIQFQMFSTEKHWKIIKPEYLTTVHIAQSIVEKNKDFAWPYFVKLEENTSNAFDNCFAPVVLPKMTWPRVGFFKSIYRLLHKSTRNGKFDIVIYQKVNNIPRELKTIHVIEVKNFDPYNSEIKKDIERIAEIVNLTDPTGPSSFLEGYLTFSNDLSQFQLENGKEKAIDKIKKKYSWVNDLNFNIVIDFDSFPISSQSPTDEFDMHKAHFFIGNILKINRKS
jgi:hypothetical protein